MAVVTSCENRELESLSNDNGDGKENLPNFAYLVDKNNSFALPVRVFFTFVHFFGVVSKITTCNSQIRGFMKNVSTRG